MRPVRLASGPRDGKQTVYVLELILAPPGSVNGKDNRMREREKVGSWVVYLMTFRGDHPPMKAVCTRREWEAMERSKPGYHTLVQDGITDETEAEKLARGTSGNPPPRQKSR